MRPFLAEGDPNHSQVDTAFHHALNADAWEGAPVSKGVVMIGVGALVILIILAMIDKRSLVPRGLFRNAMESIALFIRDMTRESHLPDRYLPLFATFFLFILTLNLLGMIPIPQIGYTATSNLNVTGALA